MNNTSELFGLCWSNPIFKKICPEIRWVENEIDPFPDEDLIQELRKPQSDLCVFPLSYTRLVVFGENGWLLSLKEHFTPQELKGYAPQALQLAKLHGTLLGIPEDITPFALIIQNQTLQKFGFSAPETWEMFESQLSFFKKKSRDCPFIPVSGTGTNHTYGLFLALLRSNGIPPLSEVKDIFNYREAAEGAYNFFLKLMEKGLCDPSDTLDLKKSGKGSLFFQQGRSPFYFDGVSNIHEWHLHLLQSIILSPFPKGPCWQDTPVPIKGSGTAWCIPRNTIDPEKALETMRKIRAPETLSQLEKLHNYPFPAYRPLWSNPEILKRAPLYKFASSLIQSPTVMLFESYGKANYLLEATLRKAFKNRYSFEQWFALIEKGSVPTGHIYHPIISNALNYIKKNLSDIQNIGEIAEAVRLNPSYFRRLFKKESGVTCENYLIRIRMEEAEKLIQIKDLTIKEIAYRVGFRNPDYFSKAFHKYWGKSASTLRKKERGLKPPSD